MKIYSVLAGVAALSMSALASAGPGRSADL